MAKRKKGFKCWKKSIARDMWTNKTKNKKIAIETRTRPKWFANLRGYYRWFVNFKHISDNKIYNSKPFRTKDEAIKSSKSYMGKHDRC